MKPPKLKQAIIILMQGQYGVVLKSGCGLYWEDFVSVYEAAGAA